MEEEKKETKKKISYKHIVTKQKLSTEWYYFLAVAVPLVLLSIVYACHEIYPFGDHTYLRVDFYHQYAPFAKDFVERIRNGESLLYAWNLGLGSNYLAVYAYYLASPTNFFLLLVPQSLILEALNAQIFLKCGLSAFFFAFYLSQKNHEKKMESLAFIWAYAMSGFFLAYAGNIIWLDNMALLPLVLWSVEQLVLQRKKRWYLISMGICIFSNFYMAFLLGIFLILWFLVQTVSFRKNTILKFLKSTGWFALCTFYLLGLCAVILLPMALTLKQTQAGGENFPDKLDFYFSFIELFYRMYVNVELNLLGNEVPNIFTSVITLILIPMYFFNPAIRLRNKISYGLLYVFMLLSLNLNALDYLWHGCHIPNNFPAREGGFFVFLCVIMAYEAYRKREGLNRYVQLVCEVLVLAAFAASWIFQPESDNTYKTYVFITTVSFLLVYSVFLFLARIKKLKIQKYIPFIILLIMAAEVCTNVAVTGFTSTVTRSKYQQNSKELAQIVKYLDDENEDFYRVEKLDRTTSNDGSWVEFNNTSFFSSTVDYGIKEFCADLGLRTSSVSYTHDGATPFVDMLFSVKYLIAKDERQVADTSAYIAREDENPWFLYENKYSLPMGFVVPTNAEDRFEVIDRNPFATQESLAGALTDDKIKMYYSLTGIQELRYPDTQEEKYDRTIHIWDDRRVFIYVTTYTDEVKVTIDDGNTILEKTYDDIKFRYILDLGVVPAGSVVRVSPTDDDEDSMDFKAYYLNEEELARVYDKLSQSTMKTKVNKGVYVLGEVDSVMDGKLLTSIPYDEGWTAKVDGKKVEIESFQDALITIPISKGHHEVELNYVPQGFTEGIIITTLCVLLGGIIFFIRMLKQKRKTENKRKG